MASWREYIASITADYVLSEPVSARKLNNTEAKLGYRLPNELRELLQESNGIYLQRAEWQLILKIEDLQKDNLHMWRAKWLHSYMPLSNLLFFGAAGNGDLFAFPISRGGEVKSDVFVWNHEDDSRLCCAPSLRTFLLWWHERKIRW